MRPGHNVAFLAFPADAAGKETLRAEILAAPSAVLAFAASEGATFWETRAEQLMRAQADILIHPDARKLPKGADIFLSYLRGGCRHCLSGRMFTRELGMRALEHLETMRDAHVFPVRPVFAALLHLHARRCAGMADSAPVSETDRFARGPGRLMALAAVLQHVAPECRRLEEDPALALSASEILENLLLKEREACLRDAEPSDFLRYGTEIDVLRALIVSHPLMRAARDKAVDRRRSRLLKVRLAASTRWFFSGRSDT